MTDAKARDDFYLAQQNEKRTAASSEKAAGAHLAAKSARDTLVGDAAAGKPVQAENIRAAEEIARSAEIDAEIAALVHSTALRLRDEAEIAKWHAEAERLDQQIQDCEAAIVAAGASVDATFAAIQKAVDFFNAASESLWKARKAASQFNGDADDRKTHNPILAAVAQGEQPAARANFKTWNFSAVEAMVCLRGSMNGIAGRVGNLAAQQAAYLRRPDLIENKISETI